MARVIIMLFFILLLFCTLCLFLIILIPLTADVISYVYEKFPNQPSQRFDSFLTASGTIVAIFSVCAAIVTFAMNARAARQLHRKQHTITVLLETRHSQEFQDVLQRRLEHFPENVDITYENWNEARNAHPSVSNSPEQEIEANSRRESARAVTTLLNYYEFIAVCISEGDLDETMLKKTLRSIMCNLVDDCRLLIAAMQQTNPSTYEHLTALYADWRKHDARDINNNPNERPIPQIP